jgi:hypothetical protein
MTVSRNLTRNLLQCHKDRRGAPVWHNIIAHGACQTNTSETGLLHSISQVSIWLAAFNPAEAMPVAAVACCSLRQLQKSAVGVSVWPSAAASNQPDHSVHQQLRSERSTEAAT